MSSADVLVDAFQRIRDAVHPATNGLSRDELAYRPGPEGNSIAWLVWHLARVQDDHVAALAGAEQIWLSKGWAERFALPLPFSDTGYGHAPDEVGKVVADAALLLGYFEDVHEKTLSFVESLREEDLARVVDRSWDPPVTVAARLVSVVADDLQHAGQAAYVRGILTRR
jgi:uncharacterized damage-inducible protein DinB